MEPTELTGSILSSTALEAEKVILSVAMRGDAGLNAMLDARITSDSFSATAHKFIWRAINETRKAGKPVDILILKDVLETKGQLESCGGAYYVADLYSFATYADQNGATAATIAKNAEQKRALRVLANEINDIALDRSVESEEGLSIAEKAMSKLRDTFGVKMTTTIRQACRKVIDELEWQCMHPGEVRGYKTGFWRLDSYLDGLVGGRMIVFAARPGVGKTAILINILQKLSVEDNIPCGLFSLEMPADQIVARMISTLSGFNSETLRRGVKPTQGDLMRFSAANQKIAQAPLFIDDQSQLTIETIQARARRMVKEEGVKVIGVDYIGLIRSSSKQAAFSREREISEISAGLKSISKELNVPVIALSQLNREVEKRKNGLPQMSDLRDSGSVEQDADQICFIHRPVLTDAKASETEAWFLLLKNRHGSIGKIKAVWEKETTKYAEASEYAFTAK